MLGVWSKGERSRGALRPLRWGSCALLASVLFTPTTLAGGLEYPAPGTRALGRAGAFTAKADDPMALAYNPARLADIDGTQIQLNANLALFDACVTRTGTFTDNVNGADISRFGSSNQLPGMGGYAREEFPKVCNRGGPGPGPALAFAMEITPWLGIGAGILAPVTAGSLRWGSQDAVVTGVNGEERPNPLRYMILSSDGFVIFPTVGAGVRLAKFLRVGAAFQAGFASLDLLSYSRASGGENPSTDGRTDIELKDTFVPAAIFSVAASIPVGIDVGAAFRWSADIEADATVDLLLGDYGTGEIGSTVPAENRFENADVIFPMPWQLTAGVRYALRRDDAPAREDAGGRSRNPMSEEVFDIEVDFVYEMNSRVDEVLIRPQSDATITTRTVINDAGDTSDLTVEAGTDLTIPHEWRDQIGLRVGGDYNLLKDLLALRAGVSFESNGVNPSFVQTDFIPAQRVGVHVGGTVRLGPVDVSAGYAHLFQETVVAAPSDSGESNAAELTAVVPGGSNTVINAGKYEVSWNVVSIGAGVGF